MSGVSDRSSGMPAAGVVPGTRDSDLPLAVGLEVREMFRTGRCALDWHWRPGLASLGCRAAVLGRNGDALGRSAYASLSRIACDGSGDMADAQFMARYG